MKVIKFSILAFLCIALVSCGDDGTTSTNVEAPVEYQFERNGASTVSYGGQTTRLLMAEELNDMLLDWDNQSVERLQQMYNNIDENGNDVSPFSSDELNISTKSIVSKVAASKDLFDVNVIEGFAIKQEIEFWMDSQVNVIAANRNQLATPGVAGQIADGTTTRYINGQGLEYDQAVIKSLLGALMLDQIVNNYLSPAVLDDGDNRMENDSELTEEAQSYTTMEHKWDEAFGYVFGLSDPSDYIGSIGGGDSFINKYLGRVIGDDDFSTMATDIYDAFKLGRAAIVAKDYTLRDEQAEILKGLLSDIVGIRAVYYLQQAKIQFGSNVGGALHGLSEGYGFIYSLRFARAANSTDALFTREEVDGFIASLMGDGPNGLWDVTNETLDQISDDIAAKFGFTVAQAGS